MEEMKAGPELDALVAEKVMGIKPKKILIATNDGGKSAAAIEDPINGPFYTQSDIWNWVQETPGYKLGEWLQYPPYSTSIEAAWEVVERLKAHEYYVGFWLSDRYGDHTCPDDDSGPWYAAFCIGFGVESASGETVAHAIALAALKAVGAPYPIQDPPLPPPK